MSGSTSFLAEIARLTADRGGDWGPSNGTALAHAQSVKRVAEKMRRIFQLPMLDAPGLTFVGGEADPAAFGRGGNGNNAVSVAGSGTDLLGATNACVCEAVEYLSQLVGMEQEFRRDVPDGLETGLDRDVLAQLLAMMGYDPRQPAPSIRWSEATRVSDGTDVLLPAALCVRGVKEPGGRQTATKHSTGCGAGPTREAALLHGLLELVERDAVAMWWLGGRRGRELARGPAEDAAAYIGELRRHNTIRTSWLIDLTTDIAIPCVAAVSVGADGCGLACGFSARLSYREAARAAIREMCQMELGLRLITLKLQQRGQSALNDVDRMYLRRAYGFDVRGCELLHPARGGDRTGAAVSDASDNSIGVVSDCLARHGIAAFWADLTRPELAICSGRAVAAGLQPYPSSIVTARLQRQIQDTGGGFGLTDGLELM